MSPSPRLANALAATSLLTGLTLITAFTAAEAVAKSGSDMAGYRDTQLPGRLVVNSNLGDGFVFNLRSGERLALPRLMASGRNASKDIWTAGSGPLVLRWYSNIGERGKVPLFVFDSRTWRPLGELKVNAQFIMPKLSPDGRYILSFWRNLSEGEGPDDVRLTVFDTRSSRPVKRGSRLDGKLMLGNLADWLPDGRYVYRAARKLYVSSPTAGSDRLLAELPLPDSVITGGSTAGGAVSVSPDGTRLAFTMGESRGSSRDTHIWVVNLDGTGLHRLTSAPNPRSGSNFNFGSPTWSPDGKWVAGVLDMKGAVSAPVFPPGDTIAPASQIIGTTGCGTSPVVVVPANADRVPISWPAFDARYNVKVKAPSGRGVQWLSSCGSIAWLP